jgi:hypothetical protein
MAETAMQEPLVVLLTCLAELAVLVGQLFCEAAKMPMPVMLLARLAQ